MRDELLEKGQGKKELSLNELVAEVNKALVVIGNSNGRITPEQFEKNGALLKQLDTKVKESLGVALPRVYANAKAALTSLQTAHRSTHIDRGARKAQEGAVKKDHSKPAARVAFGH